MTDGEADESVTRRGFLLGSAGVVAAGAAGTAAAQESGTTTSGGEGSSNSSSGGGGGATKTVKVGPGGDLVFDPDKLTVTPGTTVKFVWESDGHNVVPESQPEGAGWEGSGSASELFDTGYTYSHTFSTAGEYAYHCAPHKSAGMTGTITVGAAGGGSSEPAIPGNAKTLGLATSGALAFTLSLGYFFMKFGGDYGESIE